MWKVATSAVRSSTVAVPRGDGLQGRAELVPADVGEEAEVPEVDAEHGGVPAHRQLERAEDGPVAAEGDHELAAGIRAARRGARAEVDERHVVVARPDVDDDALRGAFARGVLEHADADGAVGGVQREGRHLAKPRTLCYRFVATMTIEQTRPKQLRADDFPDLDDPVMFPRMSEAKLERLAKTGTLRSYAAGEVLVEQGQRDAPFLVVMRGRVRVLDRKPGKDIWVAEGDPGTFLGDIATFTGEPAVTECVASDETDVISFEREDLRAMLVAWPEMAEMVLQALMARREWHVAHGHGMLRLIAPRGSRRAFEVRDLLERNLVPVRWYDADDDEESGGMLRWLQIPPEETPILVRNQSVLRNPSAAQVARELGLRADVDGERFDLVVLGGGPAGLAAAVYGGSEGLRTLVTEAWAPGGQAGTSTRIENYLGFPSGISGEQLTRKATLQARRFDAVLSSFHRAVELARGPEGLVRVDLDDGQHALARTVVVATGARWRTLAADGVERFTGAGVYHAAMASDAERCRGEDVIVVGGGNSAGQAAVHLSRGARSVRVVVRGAGAGRHDVVLPRRADRGAPEHRGRHRHRDQRRPRQRPARGGRPARPGGRRRAARRRHRRVRDDRRRSVHGGRAHDALARRVRLHPLRRGRRELRRPEPLARTGAGPAPARDRLARRVRRGRRPRRGHEACRRRRRRRRAGRALRPSGARRMSGARTLRPDHGVPNG